jgi:hypothetical protein
VCTIVKLCDPSVTDQQWQDYFGLLGGLHARHLSPFTNDSWQAHRERLMSLCRQNPHFHRYLIFDEDDQACGWVTVRVHNVGKEHQEIYMQADLYEEAIGAELAAALRPTLGQLIQVYGENNLLLFSTDGRSARLGELLEGQRLSGIDRFRLFREKANHDLMQRWRREIPAQYPELRMEIHPELPLDVMEDHCRLMEQFIHDMPAEEEATESHFDPDEMRRRREWRLQNNVYLYSALLFDQDKLIGFSNAHVHGQDPSHVFQMMTGIVRPYRGRGLAKWLKAAMFGRVGEEFPGNVSFYTDMRSVNEPIRHINSLMGYEYESSGAEYRIKLDSLTGDS